MPDPKKNVAFTFDISLVSSMFRPGFQSNPTLASGDVQISKDNGAFANITTLPTVTPSGGRVVQVALSATEMNADRVDVQFVDAAGGEWDDVLITINTSLATIDDVNTTVTTIDGRLDTEIPAIKAKTDQMTFTNPNKLDSALLAAGDFAQAAADKAWNTTSRTLTAFGTTLGKDIWDVLESNILVANSIGLKVKNNLDVAVSTRLATSGYTAPLTAAGTRAALGMANADLDTQLLTIKNLIDTEVAAIKAKTDQLTFTNAGKADASIQTGTDFAQTAADKVWGTTSRTITGLTANALSNIWGTLETDIIIPNSIGLKIKTNLDATVSSRLSTAGYTAPLTAAGTRSALGMAAANLDLQLSNINFKVQALPSNPAAAGGEMSLSLQAMEDLTNFSLDLADTVEVGMTQRQQLRLLAAAAGGEAQGLNTNNVTYFNAIGGTVPRVTANVDFFGNRSLVTLDLTTV